MTTVTENTSVLAQYIKTKLEANKTSLGLNMILYGNHNDIPKTPCAVVTPGIKRRELRGVAGPGGRTFNVMNVFVMIFTDKVGDETTYRLEIDQLSEKIEKLLHQDVQMGGLLIHGFVQEWNPSEVFLPVSQGSFRTVRMTFVGTSETYLSQ